MITETPLLEQIRSFVKLNDFQLPVANDVATKMRQLTANDSFSISEVDELIHQDPSLTTEVLRVSNSAFFGGLSSITSVRMAIVRLGVKKVLQLVTLTSEKNRYTAENPLISKILGELWHHALACSAGAGWLARELGYDRFEDECFIGGLTHDVGKLFLARVLDEMMTKGDEFEDLSVTLIEELLRESHAEEGLRLLKEWRFPEVYQRIVEKHHDPIGDSTDIPLALVRIANNSCRRLGLGLEDEIDSTLELAPELAAVGANDLVIARLEVLMEDTVKELG